MLISDEAKELIFKEFNSFKELQYIGKTVEERKKLNQFFTPPELSIKLIEKLPDLNGKIIDPCCGAANLIMAAAIVKKVDLKEKDINVYGFDIDNKILKLAKKRFENYFHIEFNNLSLKDATKNWNVHFDKCITNPPFNKNGANLIELEIIKEIIKNTDYSSILCTITNITDICGPLKQGNKYNKYKEALNGKLDDIEIIKNSQSYFDIDLAKELGILKIVSSTNKNYDGFRFIQNGINYSFVYNKIYKRVVEENIGINKQWADEKSEFSIPLKVLVSKNNYNILSFGLKERDTNHSFKPATAEKKCSIKVAKNLTFFSLNEKNNFYYSVMNKFFFFLVKHCLTSQNIKNVNKFLPYMNDYSHIWTNEMYYDYFNLSKEERELIEQEMSEYINSKQIELRRN